MKKLYCVICGKYRKFKISRISYIFEKTSVFSIICIKWENEDEKIFKEEESIEILTLFRMEGGGEWAKKAPLPVFLLSLLQT